MDALVAMDMLMVATVYKICTSYKYWSLPTISWICSARIAKVGVAIQFRIFFIKGYILDMVNCTVQRLLVATAGVASQFLGCTGGMYT